MDDRVDYSGAIPTEGSEKPAPRHAPIVIGLVLGGLCGLGANLAAPGLPPAPWDADGNGLLDGKDWLAPLLTVADVMGRIFLRLMFMVVVPLVFSALALAVIELGDLRRLGRVGWRTLLYTSILSSSAVLLGVGLVNLMQPGKSLPQARRDALEQQFAAKTQTIKAPKSLIDMLVDVVPENPLQEMVGAVDGSSKGNGMLAVMFFALVCGAAMSTQGAACAVFADWLRGLYSIAMTVITFAMRLAPWGAGALVFALAARLGLDILVTLAWFVATVLLGLGIHLLVVYPLVLRLCAGWSPVRFFQSVSEAMLMAFGTSSSSATLPTALRVAQKDLGLEPEIASFVLTVGATGNQNGTALYEGVVVLFLAQVFGVELTWAQQFMVVLMSILAGIGTAGVPGGSLPLIAGLLQSVHVPGAAIGVILGVDRVLDMCRTVLNVTGDLVVAACVARSLKPRENGPGDSPPAHPRAFSE